MASPAEPKEGKYYNHQDNPHNIRPGDYVQWRENGSFQLSAPVKVETIKERVRQLQHATLQLMDSELQVHYKDKKGKDAVIPLQNVVPQDLEARKLTFKERAIGKAPLSKPAQVNNTQTATTASQTATPSSQSTPAVAPDSIAANIEKRMSAAGKANFEAADDKKKKNGITALEKKVDPDGWGWVKTAGKHIGSNAGTLTLLFISGNLTFCNSQPEQKTDIEESLTPAQKQVQDLEEQLTEKNQTISDLRHAPPLAEHMGYNPYNTIYSTYRADPNDSSNVIDDISFPAAFLINQETVSLDGIATISHNDYLTRLGLKARSGQVGETTPHYSDIRWGSKNDPYRNLRIRTQEEYLQSQPNRDLLATTVRDFIKQDIENGRALGNVMDGEYVITVDNGKATVHHFFAGQSQGIEITPEKLEADAEAIKALSAASEYNIEAIAEAEYEAAPIPEATYS